MSDYFSESADEGPCKTGWQKAVGDEHALELYKHFVKGVNQGILHLPINRSDILKE